MGDELKWACKLFVGLTPIDRSLTQQGTALIQYSVRV